MFGVQLNSSADRFGTIYLSPDEGGGGDGGFDGEGGEDASQGNGLYDLSSAPEELRPYLEEQLRQVDKNVNSRFQEHAAYKQQWSPYEEMGLADVPQEDLQDLLAFRDLLSDQEGFKGWLQSAAEQVGLDLGAGEMDQDSWFEYGQANGFFDDGEDDGAEDGGIDQDALMSQIMGQLEERLAPISNFISSQEREQAVGGAEQELTASLDRLTEEHGEFDHAAVIGLAHAFVEQDDPIAAAFAEYQRIVGAGQSDLLDTKSDQPAGALSNGRTDTSPPTFNGLDDPALKDAARARFAASN